MLSLLVFGLTMIELYTVSAVYHIGRWREPVRKRLRALDHANIFLLIAGTYTPLCFNVLSGWLRPTILLTTWALAALGVGLATLTLRAPRWLGAALYVAMGWVSVIAFPAPLRRWGWSAARHRSAACSTRLARGHLCPEVAESIPTDLRLPRGLPSVCGCGQPRLRGRHLDLGRALPTSVGHFTNYLDCPR